MACDGKRLGVSDQPQSSFSFSTLAQPFYGLLPHGMAGQSGPGAIRQQSAKKPLRRASEMGGLAYVPLDGREGVEFWSL